MPPLGPRSIIATLISILVAKIGKNSLPCTKIFIGVTTNAAPMSLGEFNSPNDYQGKREKLTFFPLPRPWEGFHPPKDMKISRRLSREQVGGNHKRYKTDYSDLLSA